MKPLRYSITLVVFITSLFIGFQAGDGVALDFSKHGNPLAQTLTKPAPAPATFLNGQRSVLVIGADDLQASSPRLESVWLVLLIPPEPHLTLIPIYPYYPGGAGSPENNLASTFGLNKIGELSIQVEFLQELRQHDIWWSDYVVFDQESWQLVMDYISSESTIVDAIKPKGAVELEAYFDKLSMLEENPREAVLAQADLYRELCWEASRFDFRSGSAALLDQLSGHMLSSSQLQEMIVSLKTLEWSAGLSCEFPTLSQNASR